MKICILGGDKKQLQIIKHLKDNHELTLIGYEKASFNDGFRKAKVYDIDISIYDSIIFPVDGVDDDGYINTIFGERFMISEDFLIYSKNEVLIFTGIISPKLQKMLDKGKVPAISLMSEPDVIKENIILIAENIIANIIYNAEVTINGAEIFLIGYDDLSKMLLSLLSSLGANVTLGVENKEKLTNEFAIDINDIDQLKIALFYSDIIIKTEAIGILSYEVLDSIKDSAYLLDISSHIDGIDVNYANKRGLKNQISPLTSLSTAPITSGLILSKKINQLLVKEKMSL